MRLRDESGCKKCARPDIETMKWENQVELDTSDRGG